MKKNLIGKSKIVVEPTGVCDAYEVGNWTDYYSFIKLGYKVDDYESKIFDTSFCIKDNGVIVGYFLAYNVVNVDEKSALPLYSRKLVLYDFAISARAYAKYGLILINFLINYAKNNGYNAVEIKKINKYSFFLDFLRRNFELCEFDGNFYIMIDQPKIKSSEKHLVIYEGDKVQIDDLYFLCDLKFSVGKKTAKLKLTENESITIDRASGKIAFPSNVEIVRDDVVLNSHTRSIVYLICTQYDENRIENLQIDYSATKPNVFEIYAGDKLYVNKSIPMLIENVEYVLTMIKKGIKHMEPCVINYDMNSQAFSYSCGGIDCEELRKIQSRRAKAKQLKDSQ